LIFFSQ